MLTSPLECCTPGAVHEECPGSDLQVAFPAGSSPISVLNRCTGKQSQCIGKMAAHEPGRGKLDLAGCPASDPSLARVPSPGKERS